MYIYRASSLGGCTKALIAQRIGYEGLKGSGKMDILFAEGDLHEEAVVKRLEAEGNIISDRQLEVNLVITEGVVVQGHIDGLKCDEVWDPTHLLEIKSMGVKEYSNWIKMGWDCPGLIQKYKWQVSMYMLALGLPLYFVVKNRNNGQLDISTKQEPFYSMDDIKLRVLRIEKAAEEQELPQSCDFKMWPCPWAYLEEDAEEDVLGPNQEVTTEDRLIEELGLEYNRCQLAAAQAKREQEEARQNLLTGMGDEGKVVGKTAVGRVTVNVYPGFTETVDRDRMVEDGVWEEYVTVGEYRGIRVTVKRGKGKDE